MYNNRQIGAEIGGKEYLASNQVVGGSSPSGRAKFIKYLTHFRKFESSNRTTILQQISDYQHGNRWLGKYRRKCF